MFKPCAFKDCGRLCLSINNAGSGPWALLWPDQSRCTAHVGWRGPRRVHFGHAVGSNSNDANCCKVPIMGLHINSLPLGSWFGMTVPNRDCFVIAVLWCILSDCFGPFKVAKSLRNAFRTMWVQSNPPKCYDVAPQCNPQDPHCPLNWMWPNQNKETPFK